MSDSLADLSQRLAKALVLHRPDDGPTELVEVVRRLNGLAESGSELGLACEELLAGAGPSGADPAFLEALERITLLAGNPDSAKAGSGTSATAADEGPDPEMLEMFVAGMQEHLRVVEGFLLEIESGENGSNRLPEIRRSLHTMKGECGVLSLEGAGRLLHAAESAIDRAHALGAMLPLQDLFEVVDWMGKLRAHLLGGGNGSPNGWQPLEERFERFASEGPVESPTTQPQPHPEPEPEPESKVAPSTPAVATAPAPSGPDTPVTFPPEIYEDETLQDFLVESEQHLEDAEAGLLSLESLPDDPEPLNVVFRAFHTIKGVAGFLNLEPIVRLAHVTETLLDQGRKGERLLTSGDVELFLTAKDALARLLGSLAGEEAPGVRELDQLVGRVEAALRGETPGGAAPITSTQNAVEDVLCAAGIESAEELEEAAASPDGAVKRIGEVLIDRTSLSSEELGFALERQQRLAASGRSIRIGELLVELGLVTQAELDDVLSKDTAESKATKALLQAPTKAPAMEPEAAKKLRVDPTVMVTTKRLDLLVDMVGELVIAQQMIQQAPELEGVLGGTLERNLAQVQKITRDLQEASMSLRMVTFKSTFQKMSRLARDVSAKSGKDVQLVLSGADTEVDRTVVEKISDPLVHILRNAIDHGLESPDDREAAGKPRRGTVELRALHQGGAIVIEVADDGRGISREKILAKAVQVGLLPDASKADDWPDGEVFKLIFAPGFSTAEKVTDISGRGVGMDVVRKNIEGMRGKIEIRSDFGHGSTFTLRLPLTLAIIDGMVVRVGEDRYVVPTLSIVQSLRAEAAQLHSSIDRGDMIDVRGRLVSLAPLKECLGEPFEDFRTESGGVLILLESGQDQLCIVVDEILGQQQVVIKNLGKSLPSLPGVSGGAILGDGRVAVILDVERLIQSRWVAA